MSSTPGKGADSGFRSRTICRPGRGKPRHRPIPTTAGSPGWFARLVPGELIVEVIEFETDDPAMQGEMTITTTLADIDGRTELSAEHASLPPGLSPVDNETGWRMALEKLKALVEED